MKKLEIISVEIENFLSFKKKQTFYFKNRGVHIIVGENHDMQDDPFDSDLKNKNGAGKSSILKAVDFGLFGDNPNKKVKIESLINKDEGRNLCVCVNFRVDTDVYRIERYRKYKSKNNGLYLMKYDGNAWEDITLADIKLTQERIEDIIFLNHETFLKSILLTREGPKSFIELPWHERSHFLESIVRLDKLKEYSKKVKQKLSENRKELNDVLSFITSNNASIQSYKKIIKKEIDNLRNKKSESLQKIAFLKEEIYELAGEKISDDALQNLTKESHLYYSSFKNIYDKVLLKKHESNEAESLEAEIKSIVSTLEKKNNEIEKKERELEEMKVSKEGLCQHCGKEPNDFHKKMKESLAEGIASSKKETEALAQLIISREESLTKKTKVIFDLTSAIKDSKKSINDSLLPPLLKKGIEQAVMSKEQFIDDKFFKTIKDKLKEIDSFSQYSYDLSSIKNSRILLKEEKVKKSINEVHRDELNKLIEIGEFWDAALDFRNEGSLKNFIMAKVVPIFNNILDSMINVIFDGLMKVTFDNSWNENITYNGHSYDYENLSLGEQTKLNLCISLSLYSLLRINIGGTNCIFMDEVFSSVDEVTINKFINILKTSYSEDVGIYIISHEAGFRNFIPDSVIKVIKKNAESAIAMN